MCPYGRYVVCPYNYSNNLAIGGFFITTEPSDMGYIVNALGSGCKSLIARNASLSQERLSRSFSDQDNLTLKTTLAVI